MDQMVAATQEWLNKTYTGRGGYSPIDVDGITGWTTIQSLTQALQMELGLGSDGLWGPNTEKFCPSVNSSYDASTEKNKNIVTILQGGLFCKGYDGGDLSGNFTQETARGVLQLKTDAGLTNSDETATPIIFKVLLSSMDGFILASEGDSKIRQIQQNLNRDYHSFIGLIPCNGIYSRDTNRALIKALQIEEGCAADGIWGESTLGLCPTIPGSRSTKQFVLLLQYSLYVNGIDPNGFDGLFGNGLSNAIKEFQGFCALPVDGYAGKQVWASLLVSTGDTSRQGTACDCSTTITVEKAKTLKNEGYQMVGRYLTGIYALTSNEVSIILQNGLSIIPIYEVGGYKLDYFDYFQGMSDAEAAIGAASRLGIPYNSIIYFAVDFDALDQDINSAILPYFKGINDVINFYKIGIYAPRNVCSKISAASLSCSSFVCDMSSGFSGNLGYPLPKDWAFDQISTKTIGSGAGLIEIDNNISSGKDKGFNNININAWKPTSVLAKIVHEIGFLYDPNQDIIYSIMNPHQRDFGYCKFYDDCAAPYLSSIIDCEPIYFTYEKENQDWLIEFWKGQYGIETGAEIGLYNRPSGITDFRDEKLGKFFHCVGDSQRLTMSFVLKRNGVTIFKRGPEEHWWLTGFKWGEFTNNPSDDLTMTATITLLDPEMRIAFLQGLKDLGYLKADIDISETTGNEPSSSGPIIWSENTVTFTLAAPKSEQPQSKIDDFVKTQENNKEFVSKYDSLKKELGLTSNDPNLIEESLIRELSTEVQEAYDDIINWFSSFGSIFSNILNDL